ncbi:hypothetical protein R1sor_021786 [Riccia sorocarpa]|uniref:MULE transposase domain-containing protein n=1 Tax=Riccia sorocarpa TaxID=122646 RepID=A0ABD3GL59_9MARC
MRCMSRQDRLCVNRHNSAENRRTNEKRRAIERFRCRGRVAYHPGYIGWLSARSHVYIWKTTSGLLGGIANSLRGALEFLDRVAESLGGTATGEPDQLKSSKDFIERSENRAKGFELILYEDNDEFEAISFLTSFWRYISTVKEVLTDSTFKMNDMQFETFALIRNLGGFGVPLCYMFYLKKTSMDESTPNVYQAHGCRKGLLYDWICKLRDKGLRPVFFITDKDASQIEAAQRSILEMHVQLCLKHCLDAIERRMAAVDKCTNSYDPHAAHNIFQFIDPTWGPSIGDTVTGSICPPEHRPNVKTFVSQHFNIDPLIPDLSETQRSGEELHELATMRPESDPWYEQPAFVDQGMPEDIGIGGIDLNEDPIEMIPGDDPETKNHRADENVAAIAGLLSEVNVSDDDESGGEAAPHGRHYAEGKNVQNVGME